MSLAYDPAWGIAGLGLYSFLAATLLPGGSEVALYALLRHDASLYLPALAVATTCNTLGGLTTWACGRALPQRLPAAVQARLATVQRWGSPALLFSWTPLIGDALCLAAGWLRLHWLPCLAFMALGKGLRYWLVAQGALIH